jgi:hypothetical protein
VERAAEDVDDQDDEAQAVEKDAFEELKKLATASLNEKPSEVIFSLFICNSFIIFLHFTFCFLRKQLCLNSPCSH